jgi:hypothetical protein
LGQRRFDGVIFKYGCCTLSNERKMSGKRRSTVADLAPQSGGGLTKDPIIIGGAWLCMVVLDLMTPAIKAIPQKAPTKDQAQLTTFPIL